MLESARWTRPIGRWIRLLLLIAGDVERHPGSMPCAQKNFTPRGELDMMGNFAQATSLRMRRCLELFGVWCSTVAGMSL